jgi:hypothetical protein
MQRRLGLVVVRHAQGLAFQLVIQLRRHHVRPHEVVADVDTLVAPQRLERRDGLGVAPSAQIPCRQIVITALRGLDVLRHHEGLLSCLSLDSAF